MKIDPSSEAGRLLIEMGVSEEDLGATRFVRFNWQAGGAITLPIPFGGCVVLAKSRFLPAGDDGELAVGRHLALLRHEMVHVRQRKEWGFLGYWARHIWARRPVLIGLAALTMAPYAPWISDRSIVDQPVSTAIWKE